MRKEVIGNATLYLGDCRALSAFALGDLFPDGHRPQDVALITDPPYGIGFAAQPTKWQRLAGKEPEAWDDKPLAFDDLDNLRLCAAVQIIWGGNYYPLPPTRGWLSWFKPDAPPSMAHFELAWTNQDRNARQISCSIGETNAERVGHPTQKPLKVMRWCIEQAGDQPFIFDPFMGSGSTGVAAMQCGRRFLGIELEPKYFDMACERVENAQRQERLFA
jgi:site-specific DNA-methyltransferase (adenine-specific)